MSEDQNFMISKPTLDESNFNRDLELELKIDKALALRCKPGVYGFLTNIDEYIQMTYNPNQLNQTWGNKSFNDLKKMLERIHTNISYEHESFLPIELREHFVKIKDHISRLHKKHVGTKVYLEDILNEINRLLDRPVYNASDMAELISKHAWLNKKAEGIYEVEENLVILLNRGKVKIEIIFNINSIKPNVFSDSYLFFVGSSIDNHFIKNLIENDTSIRGVFLNREDRYLHNTTIVTDASRRLAKLRLQIEENSSQFPLENLGHIIKKIENRLNELNEYYERYRPYANLNTPNARGVVNSVKLIRADFLKLLSKDLHYIYDIKVKRNILEMLEKSRLELLLLANRIEVSSNFDSNLMFCLDEIKQNNTLYLLSKNKNKTTKEVDFTPFNEENLSGIIASNLRSIYRTEKHVSVSTELFLGCGRTDITIKSHNKIMGHIEFKLLKKQEDIKSKTIDGLFQIFGRYSENDGIDNRFHTGHYLVLFAHDKRIINFIDKVNDGIQHYATREKLSLTLLNDFKSEGRLTFTLRQSRKPFSDKVREITVVICNLEVDHNSRRAEVRRKSTYTP
ncbi:hypothetical protein CJF42_11110 [Pseudoalteromonas sp. NBT06-2]|uniref:hypothetical protein n=1 Tax=Pseudoalteromonas sp. NBT06-2 TaxID=2025950 RepID=UPI000BA75BDD|nr:hypothetical protein [Pseudoalteromonas sp. NBT06-2]PAJ74329.1 hypothetical protein CJF42_11110 [Pseudoalteromonas sp. NBT06-2]